MKRSVYLFTIALFLGWPTISQAQLQPLLNKDSTLSQASLPICVQYALLHFPLAQQALLDEAITDRQIKSRLSEWFPQLALNYSYQYNFQLPATIFNGAILRNGTKNSSGIGLGVTQNIFNRDVLLASRTANDIRKQFSETTSGNKIDIVVNVSKAFYDVLLTQQQIDVLNEDIIRLQRSLKDAFNQYQAGIVDKIDYKRATISLNNSKAQKRSIEENLKARYAALKLQMGYLPKNNFLLVYDSTQMVADALIDTTMDVNYDNRIEFKLLQTKKRLQEANLTYSKWSYLPTVSAFGNYNLGGFYNDNITKLYNTAYSNSYAGILLSFPIFKGTKRIQDIKVAELQVKRVDWDIISLKTIINTQYALALATYKANLNDYYMLKDNFVVATDVYNTLELQYKSGIKAYLDVITAETDLRTAQFNYTNALYQVLSSKYDLQRALGTIPY